jgi:hypothetical protein
MRVSHRIGILATVAGVTATLVSGCTEPPGPRGAGSPKPADSAPSTLAPLPTVKRSPATTVLELRTTLADPNATTAPTTQPRVVPTLPPLPVSPPPTASPGVPTPVELSDDTLPPPFMITDPARPTPDTGEIAADFVAAYTALDDCAIEPATCDITRFAAPDSGAGSYLSAKTAFWIERGLRAKPESGPNWTEVTAVEVIDADTAYATACDVDGLVMVEVHDPATAADDVVFDDSVTSTLVRWRLQLTSDGWRLVGGEELARYPAATNCA